LLKIFHRWPTTTKIRHTKIFQRRSENSSAGVHVHKTRPWSSRPS